VLKARVRPSQRLFLNLRESAFICGQTLTTVPGPVYPPSPILQAIHSTQSIRDSRWARKCRRLFRGWTRGHNHGRWGRSCDAQGGPVPIGGVDGPGPRDVRRAPPAQEEFPRHLTGFSPRRVRATG
jgi:hypothetical protein